MPMLFSRCEVCGGSLEIDDPESLIGHSRPCPCVGSSFPGWSPSGVTTAQLDRMVELERSLAGDPAIPASKAREILRSLYGRTAAALVRLESR